jgi:hypothetical protein
MLNTLGDQKLAQDDAYQQQIFHIHQKEAQEK